MAVPHAAFISVQWSIINNLMCKCCRNPLRTFSMVWEQSCHKAKYAQMDWQVENCSTNLTDEEQWGHLSTTTTDDSTEWVYVAWSKSIQLYFFFILNKRALEAESGVHVILDLCAHAWIIASCSDCSVNGNQPKHVVTCVTRVALMMTEKAEQDICITFCQKLGHSCSETCNMIQKAFGN